MKASFIFLILLLYFFLSDDTHHQFDNGHQFKHRCSVVFALRKLEKLE